MTLCAPAVRSRADRCPGALELHDAQDGALARIRTPGGRLTAAQLQALAHAVKLGNGLADLTSRANVQVRGLARDDADSLAAALSAGDLLPSPTHDRVRNILASPLAGRHPHASAPTDAIVDELDRRLCGDAALAALGGRFLFAVDDGSGLALDHVADVALVAGRSAFRLALAARPTTLKVEPAEAPAAAIAAARAFLAVREAEWRVAEVDGGAAAIAGRLGAALVPAPPAHAAPRVSPGALMQRDGRVAITALVPLGRLDAAMLRVLARVAGEVRIGTGRTLTLPDVEPVGAGVVQAELRDAGLVLEPLSGWVGLTACAGLGACPRARFDVRAAAARRAAVRAPGAPAEHWAACERRCGERAAQPVSVAPRGSALVVRCGERERAVGDARAALEVLA